MKDSNKYKDESIVYLLVDIASIAIYIFVGGGIVLLLTKSPLYSRKAGVFIISLIPHILSLIALSYMIRRIYSRSLLSYIEEGKISYKKFLLSSFITFIVLILVSIINRGTIAVNNEDTIETKLYFLILTLILIPFQTLSEEFIYRVLPEKIYSSFSSFPAFPSCVIKLPKRFCAGRESSAPLITPMFSCPCFTRYSATSAITSILS